MNWTLGRSGRRTTCGILALLVIATLSGCAVLGTPEQRGMRHLQKEEYGPAAAEFAQAIEAARQSGDQTRLGLALANRCYALDAQGYHDAAVIDCTAALEIQADDPEILNNRGVAYLGARKLDEAQADFDAAIALRPEYPEAYANRGRVHIDREDFSVAIEDLTRAVTLDDTLAEGFANRAFAHDSLGQVDEALEDYDRALERGGNALTFFNRGMLHYRYGRFQEALDDFKSSVAREPDSYVGFMAQSQVNLLESNPDALKSDGTPTTSPEGAGSADETAVSTAPPGSAGTPTLSPGDPNAPATASPGPARTTRPGSGTP